VTAGGVGIAVGVGATAGGVFNAGERFSKAAILTPAQLWITQVFCHAFWAFVMIYTHQIVIALKTAEVDVKPLLQTRLNPAARLTSAVNLDLLQIREIVRSFPRRMLTSR
jgi:hypothetical protein